MRKRRMWGWFLVMPFFLYHCAAPRGGDSTPMRIIPEKSQKPKEIKEYILGPDDTLDVLVWRNESLSRTALVRPDGKITLPLVGDLQAAGLTSARLAQDIKQKLKEFYKEQPDVFVIVTATNNFSFPIYILGEVEAPGKHILRGETTLLQALSLARGFNEYADTNHILLLRREGGYEKRMQIRYSDMISGDRPEMNLSLVPGDTIVVP